MSQRQETATDRLSIIQLIQLGRLTGKLIVKRGTDDSASGKRATAPLPMSTSERNSGYLDPLARDRATPLPISGVLI